MAKIKVIDPKGRTGFIPEKQLKDALSQGYSLPESFEPPIISGKPVLDPDSPRPNMAAEDLLPASGATLGGLLGTGLTLYSGGPLVPFGSTLGTIAGGGAGETLRQFVRGLRGKPIEHAESAGESLRNVAQVGGETGLAHLGGVAIAKPFIGAARWVRRGVTPNTVEVANIAERLGINLPIGARSESPGLQALEASLLRRPGGEKVFEARKLSEKQFEDAARKFASMFGREKGPAEAGIGVEEAFERVMKEKNAVSEKMFDELENVIGKEPATLRTTENFLKKFLKARGIENIQEGTFRSRVPFNESPQIEKVSELLTYLKNRKLTYSDQRALRTQIADLADFESAKASGEGAFWKKVTGTLTKDMMDTARNAGKADMAKQTMSFYKNYMKFLNSPAARIIQKTGIRAGTPEKLVDSIVGTNSPSNINILFKEFDNHGKDEIRRRVLDRIFEKATDETVPGGRISPAKFSGQLNKYTDETIDALFGEQAETIRQLNKISNAMARGEGLRSGSPTSILDDAKELIKLNPFPVIGRMMARYGGSSLLSSPRFGRFLTGTGDLSVERGIRTAEKAAGVSGQMARVGFPFLINDEE